jgi:hypothetical protein
LLLNISNMPARVRLKKVQLICYRLKNRILQSWGFGNFHLTIRGRNIKGRPFWSRVWVLVSIPGSKITALVLDWVEDSVLRSDIVRREIDRLPHDKLQRSLQDLAGQPA